MHCTTQNIPTKKRKYNTSLSLQIMAISSSSSSKITRTQPSVVFFPYMAQGHTIPLIDLSIAFASRGVEVTIVTTPKNAPFILSRIPPLLRYPQISLSIIPFPSFAESGLPEGCENTNDLPSRDMLLPFMFATPLLRQPFHALLQEMSASGSLPICVISDIILYWTLDVCRSFNVPRIGFHVGGVLPMTILRTAFLHHSPSIFEASFQEPITVDLPRILPSLPFSFAKSDFLDSVLQQDPHNLSPTMGPIGEADANSWGVIINSFEELEGQYVPALQSFYKANQVWCLGPFHLHRRNHDQDQPSDVTPYYIQWLDNKLAEAGSDSVIYVSFGSEANLSDKQIEEIACGLEDSGHPFVFVARSTTWVPREEGRKEIGLVVRDWVDQQRILRHPATGAFLSHCGWNSVMESLSMGVPVLGWPLGADQPLNARVVWKSFEAGLMIPPQFHSTNYHKIEKLLIGRETVREKVREMMGGDVGRKARDKAKEIRSLARQAVTKGGSSDTKLDQLIERLIAHSQNN